MTRLRYSPVIVAISLLFILAVIWLYGIRRFPIFVDEAVHVWWIERIVNDGEWLRPLNVGKPLEAWLPVIFVTIGYEPLVTMRSLHVFAGILVVISTYWIGRRLFIRPIALLAAVMVAMTPMMTFFSRMALAEIYLSMGYTITLLAMACFWQWQGWRNALLLGSGLLFSAFAKFPVGFISMIVVPLALAWMSDEERRQMMQQDSLRKLAWAYLPVFGLVMFVLFVAGFRLGRGESPGFGLWLLERQTQTNDLWTRFVLNLELLHDVLTSWFSLPVTIVGTIGVVLALIGQRRKLAWIALTAIIPLIAIMLFAADWSSRYLVFLVPPLALAATGGWYDFVSRLITRLPYVRPLAAVLAGLVSVILLYLSGLLLFAPLEFPWSASDSGTYVSDWPAGFGFPEAADFVENQDSSSDILALVVGTAKQMEFYVAPSLRHRVKQIQIQDGKPLSAEDQCTVLAEHSGAWLINASRLDLAEFCRPGLLEETQEFPRPLNGEPVILYRVR